MVSEGENGCALVGCDVIVKGPWGDSFPEQIARIRLTPIHCGRAFKGRDGCVVGYFGAGINVYIYIRR